MNPKAQQFHALMAAAHQIEAAAFGLRSVANAIDPLRIPDDSRAQSVEHFLRMKEWSLSEAEHHEKLSCAGGHGEVSPLRPIPGERTAIGAAPPTPGALREAS